MPSRVNVGCVKLLIIDMNSESVNFLLTFMPVLLPPSSCRLSFSHLHTNRIKTNGTACLVHSSQRVREVLILSSNMKHNTEIRVVN